MRSLMVLCLAASMLSGQTAKQAKQSAGQEPPLKIPAGVEVKKDIVYAKYGSREMHLDLYLPPSSMKGPFPAVVYIHGGGWRNGNKGAFSRQAAHMASLGFVGACVEYRLSGEAKWPAAINDSKAAVRWVRANADKYNVDANRIGASGGSAGGHLVGLLGTTDQKKFEGDGGNAGVSSRVSAVAAFNPAMDLVGFGKSPGGGSAISSVSAFLGATYAANPQLWAEATPITHVSSKSAKFLFLHGDADTTVPMKQSLDMMAKLKAAGVHAELFKAEGAAHGFFNRPPWFQPTQDRMEKFFQATLGK